MFTVGMEDMDEARRGVGEGEKAAFLSFFPSFFIFFFFFLHLIEHETASEGRVQIQVSKVRMGGWMCFLDELLAGRMCRW